MAKAPPRPALPHKWKRFVREYGMNLAYWYQPKGLAVTVDSVEARLRILKEFEHKGAWRDLQSGFIKRLKEEGVSKAEDEWESGGAPLARMLKQVMAVLGLAWVDPDDQVEITEAGNRFLDTRDGAVLARQALRYQFWNPAITSRQHGAIRLHPLPFLVRLLHAVGGTLTRTEYRLFASKARAIGDVDKVAELIDEFRALAAEEQRELVFQCDSYKIAGARRGSIYNTIKLNEAYALKMWTLSDLIEVGPDHSLKLKRIRGDARDYLEHYAVHGAYIVFADEKEFLAWMGDPQAVPNQETALDVYVSRNDIEAAAATAKNLGASPKEVRSFKRMLISEKTLEDNIEKNLEDFGKRIGHVLELVGRQFPTTVGPIDLLARDKKTGQYVVIELKKGRSADKVFGQLSRYMGWVKKNLANGGEVVGSIVASKIDDKLRSARDAHPTKVHLVEFESKMSVSLV